MDTVLLELQIEVGVGEAAGTPMFLGDDLAGRRYEFGAEFAAPGPILEGFVLPGPSLDGSDIRPRLIIARTVAMMHGVEDPQLRLARRIQDLKHVGDTLVGFGDRLDAGPDLATFGDEVVIRIDHEQSSDGLAVCRGIHAVASYVCRVDPVSVMSMTTLPVALPDTRYRYASAAVDRVKRVSSMSGRSLSP